MTAEEVKDTLKGNTLEIYRFLVKNNKPVGIREVQRALNLSSPSVVAYHFSKLEEAGLVKQEQGDYVVSKVILDYNIRISRFIIPRHLFYFIFAIATLIIELSILRPRAINNEYFFVIATTLIFTVIFGYEALKACHRSDL
ncbi:MAG: winged helix-turn-helix domain-containing protein [Candidatus Bathyarchaeota archaeon]|nr:winged helix-turn-helix domain-containing protein [Candidatus Bathyarchaeum sp.]